MRDESWAVVLGISTGSGAAIANALAVDPGLHIFGVHRGKHPDEAAAIEATIRSHGGRVHFRVADAGSAEGAMLGAAELLEMAGTRSVRVFVHSLASGSVGCFASGREEPLEPRQIQRTFEVMAHSFVYWAQELVRRDLLAPSARLIGLTNPCVESLLHNIGAISAAKAALEVYVRHLAWELGPKGHRVNLLKFGAVETPALRHVFAGEAWERLERAHARMTPAGRRVTSDEVGHMVSLLSSDAAAWFNGATIDFTGGQAQSLYDCMMYPERTG